MGGIGHVVAGVVGTCNFMFLTIALSDGRSLAINDGAFGILPAGSAAARYGIGIFSDSNGNEWDDSKHYLEAAGCDEHKERGLAIEAFTFMSLVVVAVAVLFNLLGAQSGKGLWGLVSTAMNGILILFMLIDFALVGSFFDESLSCTLVSRKLKDQFELGYALPLMVFVFALAILNAGVLVATGALKDE